jgi:hypothetical protein
MLSKVFPNNFFFFGFSGLMEDYSVFLFEFCVCIILIWISNTLACSLTKKIKFLYLATNI